MTVLPDEKESFIIVAAFPSDRGGLMFLDELEKLNDLQLQKAISSLMLYANGNVFFTPVFWESLSQEEKQKLVDDFHSIALSPMGLNDFYRSSINFFEDKYLGKN